MAENRLRMLREMGQSVWIDYIDRTMLQDGTLTRLIREDALMGMTSNPTIFEKALAESSTYDAQIASLAGEHAPRRLFEIIATDDVRLACDLFASTFDETGGGDGVVSIEVSPGRAYDTEGTVEEARALWREVNRPNVMIKVPGTPEGAVAIRRLIADGVNVNITLLFSVDAYDEVVEAYLSGLEQRVAAGQPVDRILSVASFFVSRVDTEADKRLDALAASAQGAAKEHLLGLRGKAAIANARRAYDLFTQRFAGPRWDALAAKGARLQRPLWASTSTKNPAYRDVMYVEELIGPHTVNTVPLSTLDAFRDHGIVRRTVDAVPQQTEAELRALAEAGVDLADVTAKLLRDGVASFAKSFDAVVRGIEEKAAALVSSR